MTATTAPGTGGTHRRRFPLAVALLMVIGISLVVWASTSNGGGDTHAITCANATRVAEWNKAQKAKLAGKTDEQSVKASVKFQERFDKAYGKFLECQKGTTTSTTLIADPAPGSCDGVTYRAYMVAGTKRFGPEPFVVTGSGDANKARDYLSKEFDTDPAKLAIMTQGKYLVDGGIGTEQIQAKAEYYKSNRAAWNKAKARVRAILYRAKVEMVQASGSYKTQEAIIRDDPCFAPAFKDTTSHGDRWLLVVHLSQQDGGRTVKLVVFCDFQIHEVTPAKPATTTTVPPPPPATTTTVNHRPPPTTTTTVPRTTTTTSPPTTTTLPPKVCTTDPAKVTPSLPFCTGIGPR